MNHTHKISFLEIATRTVKKLSPISLYRNPVIFITWMGAIITMIENIHHGENRHTFGWQITICLALTVIFSLAAETMAQLRSEKGSYAIRQKRNKITALKKIDDGSFQVIDNHLLKKNDLCLVKEKQIIPIDGQIVEGAAVIDESSFTGQSHPVLRAADTEHDTVIAGTKVVADQILIRALSDPHSGYFDRLLDAMVVRKKGKTVNEMSLSLLLSSLTLTFVIAIFSLHCFGTYFDIKLSITSQIAFLICLIPTTIAGLMSAVAVSGMNKLMAKNILTFKDSSVEVASSVDVLLFDKTGTVTEGNRTAYEFIPSLGVGEEEFHRAAFLCSALDTTPEGKSIVDFIKKKFPAAIIPLPVDAQTIPFSAHTRLSGIDLSGEMYRKGSVDAVQNFCKKTLPADLSYCIERICERGGTPLLVASSKQILGAIFLKDKLKSSSPEKFAQLRAMGVDTILLSGDNPLTTKAVAAEANIDQTHVSCSAEGKLALVQSMQNEGLIVGMVGDGVSDALALAEADLAVAMHEGAMAAKEASNMVDLDSIPSKLFDIIQISKQVSITRGALLTFCIASDVSKYLLILPNVLVSALPIFSTLNFFSLSSPDSAIASAVIFNTLNLAFLIPLSYRGVKFSAKPAKNLLQRNLIVFGIGGMVFPAICIKIIDMILAFFEIGTV